MGPKRHGHTILYDRLVNEVASYDICMIYHADMYLCPRALDSIEKYIGPKKIVSLTRIEPPLHPDGPEKVLADWGTEPEDFDENKFLEWFNAENGIDNVLKAAIAHFWFIIIHPFDDGNGRIARALTDQLLARAESSGERFYSMSSQILVERKRYYEILQKVQHSTNDITEWMLWFLECLKNAILSTEETTKSILQKVEFWKRNENTIINERQRLMLNKLFDGFEGKLKTSKWAKITKTSSDTALRDIKDLVEKGILKQSANGGRSVNYELFIE
jgi:Fic family protein